MNKKQKRNTLKRIFYIYKKLKIRQEIFNQSLDNNIWINERSLTGDQFLKLIENILLNIYGLEKIIIEKEFINISDLYWWKSFYSSATYHRHSTKAYNNFLNFIFDTQNKAIIKYD